MSDSTNSTRRQFLQATGSAAAAAAVAGCADFIGGGDGGGGDGTRTFNEINDTITTFDPVAVEDTASGRVAQQVFDTLMNYPEGQIEAEALLAESYETNDEFSTFTFSLKGDVQFHPHDALDDRQVTASDFVYSFERLAASDNSARKYFVLSNLGVDFERQDPDGPYSAGNYEPGSMAVEAVDDTTLEVTLREPFASALGMLAYNSFAVHPEGIVGDVGDYEGKMSYEEFSTSNPVGCGPFRFDFWEQENAAQVVAYDDYHGEAPRVDAVHWAVIEDDNAAFQYAINRNADFFQMPTPKFDRDKLSVENTDDKQRKTGTYGPLSNGETVDWMKVPEVSTYYFAFNTVKVPRPVRKAVAYATNQAELSTSVFKDRQPPAYHLTPPRFYPGGKSAYDDHVAGEYPYGPESSMLDEAASVMEEAGYGEDNRFELQFTHYQSAAWSELAQTLQQQLRSAYVDLNVEEAGFANLVERGQNGKLEAYTLGWIADWPGGDNFLQLVYPPNTVTSGTGVLTYTNWGYDGEGNEAPTQHSERAREAWETIASNQQPTDAARGKRHDAYVKMEEAIWASAVLVPTFHGATEYFYYDYVDVPTFGAMGHSRQMLNTVEKTEDTGQPVGGAQASGNRSG